MKVSTEKDHRIGGEADGLPAVQPHDGFRPGGVEFGVDPGAHGRETVGVLGAPEGAVMRLPVALRDIVADGVAEQVAAHLVFADIACRPADHCHQLGFVLHALGRIGRDDDGAIVAGERVDGAVADIGGFRQGRKLAALVGGCYGMLGIVEASGVEGRRHDRRQEARGLKRNPLPGRCMVAEGRAPHRCDAFALDDTVAGSVRRLDPRPAHALPPSARPGPAIRGVAPPAGQVRRRPASQCRRPMRIYFPKQVANGHPRAIFVPVAAAKSESMT